MIGPEEVAFGTVSGLLVRAIGATIAALVEHEDIEMRTIVERAVDPAGLNDAFTHRIHLVERARGPGGEQGDVALLVGGGQLLRWRPVVGDFMVVPLHDDRHLGVEGAQMFVHEIVFVRGAELVERLGDFCLLGDGYILPDPAAGKGHFVLDRSVGIDGIAGVQQEIRTIFAHGGEGEHAAVIGVDAPALSGDVATPDETDVAATGRRGAEAPEHRLARDIDIREIAKPDAVEDFLPRGQVLQQHFRREVAFGQRCDRRQRPCIGKRLRRGDLDQHLRGPIGARPHDGAIGSDVTGLNARCDDRPVGGAAEIGHCERADSARARGDEKTPTGNFVETVAGEPAGNPERHARFLGSGARMQ